MLIKKKRGGKNEISFIIFDTLDSTRIQTKQSESPNLIFRHVKFSQWLTGIQLENLYIPWIVVSLYALHKLCKKLFERWRINCRAATGVRVWPNFEHVHLDLEFSPPFWSTYTVDSGARGSGTATRPWTLDRCQWPYYTIRFLDSQISSSRVLGFLLNLIQPPLFPLSFVLFPISSPTWYCTCHL